MANNGSSRRRWRRKKRRVRFAPAATAELTNPWRDQLAGVFGRPAGSLPGYSYSPALSNSDIVWDEHSIDRLFEIGPDNLTPGSKMPMQQIASPKDRADLIAFLKRATTQD